jgi:PTH1 family peptidyl-tRNA hydrolase
MESFVIVGLGNPGDGYADTRHNAGRMVVERLHDIFRCSDWEFDDEAKALYAEGEVANAFVELLLPETYMNRSGNALKPLMRERELEGTDWLIVVYDDIDLPLGTMKISHGRGSGGHKGVDSIIRTIGTRYFTRVRIGISEPLRGGGAKKPVGEERVTEFLLSPFRRKERTIIADIAPVVGEALETLITDGRDKAMSLYND